MLRGRHLVFVGVLLTFYATFLSAQMVNVPPSHEVYAFLKRMESKHLLQGYRDAMKPLSRMYLARQLDELDSVTSAMTSVELATYEFLRTEFHYELAQLQPLAERSPDRWHTYAMNIPGGRFTADLNARLAYSAFGSDPDRYGGIGVKLQGYAADDIGYYFNWVNSREVGSNLNYTKVNTPDPGVVLASKDPTSMSYNDIDAQVSFRLGAMQVSLEQSKNVWGYGERGPIILSEKAPAYPQVKLRVPLSKSIDFVYFHAWLNSGRVDFARSSAIASAGLGPVNHAKYLAAHQLEFTVTDGVNLSIGESVVYSDRGPLLMYLIPIMFFKAAEHYNMDKDNTQIFGSADISLLTGYNFYFSLFLDDLNTDDLFNSDKSHRQIGVTVGLHTYDKLIENLEIAAEYTRINPWVYEHYYGTTDYRNSGYVLGDWIGQNADDLYFDASYRPMREVRFGAFAEIYRKGGLEDISNMVGSGEPWFLYRPRHLERSFGLYGSYQPIRDLFVSFRGRSARIEDDATQISKRQFEFTLGVQLGVW
jgi:hypothetical protein